ncbi:MAG: AI-2E family transporter [Clostridiales bacterium]|nr:AI-2E family transporter [Clostridiales bacterium]
MEKSKLKAYMLLITFSIGLVLVVVHFRDILYGIGFFMKLLTPLLIGTLLAFVLNRPYEMFCEWYQRKWSMAEKKARIISVISVYVIAIGGIVLICCMVIPELGRNLKTFAESVDQYILNTQTMLNRTTENLGLRPIDLTYLIEAVDQYLSTFSNTMNEVLPRIMKATSSVLSGIATTLISITLSVYILMGKERLIMQVRRMLKVYLPGRFYRGVRELYHIVLQVFEDYVSGQCKEAIILGSLCFAGMMVLRIDYAGLISVIIAVTALVPILGAYIGGAVAVMLLLLVSPGKALLFLAFLLILQQVEGNVIYPRVVGRKIGLPGMWVLMSIAVWGSIFGIWGMLLGVPATTIIYQLLKKDVRDREMIMKKEGGA